MKWTIVGTGHDYHTVDDENDCKYDNTPTSNLFPPTLRKTVLSGSRCSGWQEQFKEEEEMGSSHWEPTSSSWSLQPSLTNIIIIDYQGTCIFVRFRGENPSGSTRRFLTGGKVINTKHLQLSFLHHNDHYQIMIIFLHDNDHYHMIIIFFIWQWPISHDNDHHFHHPPTYGAWDFLPSRSQEQK